VAVQVGRLGRTVAEVAGELGCDWHTVNDTVMAYGKALLDGDVDWVGPVEALGLDETLFCRSAPWRTQQWCTSIIDVSPASVRLLDVVEGRSAAGPTAWINERSEAWRAGVRDGTLGLSGPYCLTEPDTKPHDVLQRQRVPKQLLCGVEHRDGLELGIDLARHRVHDGEGERQLHVGGDAAVPGQPEQHVLHVGPSVLGRAEQRRAAERGRHPA
jgi:hypothetical protein